MARQAPASENPRYVVIANRLTADIKQGKLAVGSLLPTEAEFAAKFGVSRGTMRQALAILEDAGLIVRRQKSGTRVLSRYPVRGLVDGEQIIEDWARYGTDFPLRVSDVSHATLPREFAHDAGYKGRQPWLRVEGLRYPPSARIPIAHCTAFIHPDLASIEKDISSSPVPLFALIERRHGRVIEGVRADLRSVELEPAIAKVLGAKAGAPALQLIRYFKDAKRRVVEIAVNTHPSDRFTYRIEIFRSTGG